MRTWLLLYLGLQLCLAATAVRAAEGPSSSELASARYYLELFEERVRREDGKAFELGYYEEQALTRIKTLAEQYPGHPEVAELVERARAAVKASKGEVKEITEAMLAYRHVEAELTARIGALSDAAWAERLAVWQADGSAPLLPGDSVPDPDVVGTDAMLGRPVVLEDFRWPAHQFLDNGTDYVYVGTAASGFYYVRLSEGGYRSAYAALRRFRSQVSSGLPEVWVVAGRVTDIEMAIPQAGEEKTLPLSYGWVVSAEAIYVPGLVLALAAEPGASQGQFVGEADIDALKAAAFTVDAVPADAEPQALATIFATAIKEKNYRLYTDCISPALQETAAQQEHLRYAWDINQRSYRESYVLVEPVEVSPIAVLRGEAVSDLESFFLPDESKSAAETEPLLEQVRVSYKRYDERGRPYGARGELVLERTAGGRWYVVRGFPL
jgi:hypothetical protein